MKHRIAITGLGVVSAVGTDREAFFGALARGDCAVRPHPTRESDGVPLSAVIEDIGARRYFDPRTLRRYARLSQIALVAAREALEQARAGGDPGWAPERLGVALGTGLGTLRETLDFMKSYLAAPEAASPLLFPSSVMNAAAGQVAIELGLRGVNTTLNHRDGSAFDALMLAADFLALGRADALLVGGVDEISEPVLHAARYLTPLTATAVRPYTLGRDGTAPGEGAAILVLEREEDAERRGAAILARVAGFAAGGEARARVGWRGGHRVAVEVVRRALGEAGLPPDGIDYVAGAGCGLSLDAVEAQVVAEAMAGRAAARGPVPHGSILGQTGDFLSAGALRLASAVYALDRQALPGTVGAGEPDPEAPVPGLVRAPRPAEVAAVLLPQITQGGADSALVLTR